MRCPYPAEAAYGRFLCAGREGQRPFLRPEAGTGDSMDDTRKKPRPQQKVGKREGIPLHLMGGIESIEAGLDREEMSPMGAPRILALMTRRKIFPDMVLGISLTK